VGFDRKGLTCWSARLLCSVLRVIGSGNLLERSCSTLGRRGVASRANAHGQQKQREATRRARCRKCSFFRPCPARIATQPNTSAITYQGLKTITYTNHHPI
jgi:hypothetical protein